MSNGQHAQRKTNTACTIHLRATSDIEWRISDGILDDTLYDPAKRLRAGKSLDYKSHHVPQAAAGQPPPLMVCCSSIRFQTLLKACRDQPRPSRSVEPFLRSSGRCTSSACLKTRSGDFGKVTSHSVLLHHGMLVVLGYDVLGQIGNLKHCNAQHYLHAVQCLDVLVPLWVVLEIGATLVQGTHERLDCVGVVVCIAMS
jgi:hypothetical protein